MEFIPGGTLADPECPAQVTPTILESCALPSPATFMSNPWDHPTPHILEITFSDQNIDGMGHANNDFYVIWGEHRAWEHSQSLGLTLADCQRLNRGVAIHHASYDYVQPALASEQLRIGTWLSAREGRLRLERRFQILRATDQATVLRGQ